jgi:SAM-dependent methyltransferase
MEQWFKKKFCEDLSDIRPESQDYYKHHVHHFFTRFFSEEKVRGKKILDFGCGPGFYSAILAQRGAKVVGIDMSEFLINKANELKARLKLENVEFIWADFLDCSSYWNSGEFDYIIAIDTCVSFDYCREKHSHERISRAFNAVSRILKDDGRFYIIESHPFFGQILGEITSEAGEYFCIRSQHYKIEYKLIGDVHHWFTLEEMTKATGENGLAILRIYEPEPSDDMKREKPEVYFFRLKYPAMIVYEICKISNPGELGL